MLSESEQNTLRARMYAIWFESLRKHFDCTWDRVVSETYIYSKDLLCIVAKQQAASTSEIYMNPCIYSTETN